VYNYKYSAYEYAREINGRSIRGKSLLLYRRLLRMLKKTCEFKVIKVNFSVYTIKRLEKWRYSNAHSKIRQHMDVSGQLYTAVALKGTRP